MTWSSYTPAERKQLENQQPWDGNRSTWMTQLPGFLKLSDLTIPGTHDSAALDGYVQYGVSVTQVWRIERQLQSGIRFLDLRVGFSPAPWGLDMYHGSDHINDPTCIPRDPDFWYHYKQVIGTCVNFLEQHPDEVIVVCVKLDYPYYAVPVPGHGDTVEDWFRQIANEVAFDHKTTWDTLWDVRPTVDATLDDLRGKLSLWRRFDRGGNYGGSLGVDFTALNRTYGDTDGQLWTTPDGASLYAQDYYTATAYKKVVRWCEVMWEAYDSLNVGQPNDNTQYLNFTTVGGLAGIHNPPYYANLINGALKVWLDFWRSQCPNQQPDYCHRSGIGVIPMDVPTEHNIDQLIQANFAKTLRFDNGDPTRQAFMAHVMKTL